VAATTIKTLRDSEEELRAAGDAAEARARVHPLLETLHYTPKTLNPEPLTLNPKP
jgi:hypothetical protein